MLYSFQLEEKHALELANLQSSLTLSFKEELEQVRYSLLEDYIGDYSHSVDHLCLMWITSNLYHSLNT